MKLTNYIIAGGLCGYLALSGCSDSNDSGKNPTKSYINRRDEVFEEVMRMRLGVEKKVQPKTENNSDLEDKE